jgi:hypothetical protein
MSDEPGMPLVFNGKPYRWCGLRIDQPTTTDLPVWTVDVDGFPGCAGTLEAALLIAGREAAKVEAGA